MAKIDLALTGIAFTDLPLSNVGSGVFRLEHDYFIRQDLAVRTAIAGGGTLLVEGVDYVLDGEDTYLSGIVTAAVDSGRNVMLTVQVINAAYQACALYVSGKYVADAVEAEDDDTLVTAAADVTVANGHSRVCIEMTTGASLKTATLGPVAYNLGREIDLWKVDAGAGEARFAANAAEKFLYLGAQYSNLYVGLPDQHCRVRATSVGWRIVGGVVQPVAGEPSFGTRHHHSYEIMTNYNPASTPTTYNVDLSAQLPDGVRLIEVFGYFQAATVARSLSIQDTAGEEFHIARTQAVSVDKDFGCPVLLGTDRTIRFVFNHSDCVGAYAWMKFYDV